MYLIWFHLADNVRTFESRQQGKRMMSQKPNIVMIRKIRVKYKQGNLEVFWQEPMG